MTEEKVIASGVRPCRGNAWNIASAFCHWDPALIRLSQGSPQKQCNIAADIWRDLQHIINEISLISWARQPKLHHCQDIWLSSNSTDGSSLVCNIALTFITSWNSSIIDGSVTCYAKLRKAIKDFKSFAMSPTTAHLTHQPCQSCKSFAHAFASLRQVATHLSMHVPEVKDACFCTICKKSGLVQWGHKHQKPGRPGCWVPTPWLKAKILWTWYWTSLIFYLAGVV